jgi:signal transduction histidine kinase
VIPRSIGGRLVAAFALLSLVIVLAVGGALFVVLRGLHADATLNAMNDISGGLLPQVRQSIVDGDLRGTIDEVRTQLAERGYEVMLVGSDGRLRPIGGSPIGDALVPDGAIVGQSVSGATTLGGQRSLYVATVVRRGIGAAAGAAAIKGIAVVTPDRSGAQALADLGRAIPIVLLIVLLVATPVALVLARSVTRPLERLAHATADIPAGRAAALPLAGPSEVRELTGTFNAMAAELESTRTREADLLANLRHDLRTPLTAIAGFATALRDGTAQGPSAEAAARAIEEEAGRLERLVAEVGAVERIRSGEETIRPELLDAADVGRATITRFGPRATAAGVDLRAAISDEAVPIAADRIALERMLGNLVDNAIAAAGAAGRHGGSVVLEVAAARLPNGSDAVRFDVLDDGPGFADGAAARAFERFWRGDPARSGPGSGLGLAIVRELAQAHGGSAHAENRAPRGARVGVTLPRVPWPPAA